MQNINLKKVRLSPRESDCLCLLTQGFKRKEIAQKLSVKLETIHSFVRRIKTKFNANTLQQVIQIVNLEDKASNF